MQLVKMADLQAIILPKCCLSPIKYTYLDRESILVKLIL